MKRYRVWNNHTEYIALLSEAEVVSLRRQGYYVIPL